MTRRRGKLRKLRGTGGSKPLVEKGNLLNSIRGVKGGVKMLEYGKFHHEGFTPKNIPQTQPEFLMGRVKKEHQFWFIPNKKGIKVPARPFIFADEESIEKARKAFITMVNQALSGRSIR